MTPEQALSIISQATGLLQLTRKDHLTITEALKVLSIAVAPKVQPEKAVEKKK